MKSNLSVASSIALIIFIVVALSLSGFGGYSLGVDHVIYNQQIESTNDGQFLATIDGETHIYN